MILKPHSQQRLLEAMLPTKTSLRRENQYNIAEGMLRTTKYNSYGANDFYPPLHNVLSLRTSLAERRCYEIVG
jgi:hypothetical protein